MLLLAHPLRDAGDGGGAGAHRPSGTRAPAARVPPGARAPPRNGGTYRGGSGGVRAAAGRADTRARGGGCARGGLPVRDAGPGWLPHRLAQRGAVAREDDENDHGGRERMLTMVVNEASSPRAPSPEGRRNRG